jgi:hypothetical protein
MGKRKRTPDHEPCSPPVRNGDFARWLRLIVESARSVVKRAR